MGFFSKLTNAATGTCAVCGKSTVHVGNGPFICGSCKSKMELGGYEFYRQGLMSKGAISPEEYMAFASHRDGILEKYRLDLSVPDEAQALFNHLFVYSTENFDITSGVYRNIVVDHNDVFAIAYERGLIIKELRAYKGVVPYIFYLFTNNPYMPVYYMVRFVKEGILGEDKKAREAMLLNVLNIYPNLEYPLGSLQNLEKAFKAQGIQGNINEKNMKEYIASIYSHTGIFDINFDLKNNRVSADPNPLDLEYIQKYGYDEAEKVYKRLKKKR